MAAVAVGVLYSQQCSKIECRITYSLHAFLVILGRKTFSEVPLLNSPYISLAKFFHMAKIYLSLTTGVSLRQEPRKLQSTAALPIFLCPRS
jgi:hypothetical protein